MIFTPEKSFEALKELNEKCIIKFEDCSYQNDCTDSASFESNGILIVIGFPNIFNRKPEHDEEFDKFSVYFLNQNIPEFTRERTYLYTYKGDEMLTLEEAVTAINKLVFRSDIICEPRETHIMLGNIKVTPNGATFNFSIEELKELAILLEFSDNEWPSYILPKVKGAIETIEKLNQSPY